jgi:molecular chaperone GrpE
VSQDPSQTDTEETRVLEDDQVELSSSKTNSDIPHDASSQTEIETLKNELANAQEQVLRISAEMQNFRRRSQQDIEKAHKFALEKFVVDLLPVADSLERSLEAANNQQGNFETIAEGVELTLKALVDALKRHQVDSVFPQGEPFDPQLHQAMSMVADPNVEPNTVINVFQRGYTLNGRLVRPAMVVVSKST